MIQVESIRDWTPVWSMYETAFPRCERRSWEQHQRALATEAGFSCVQISRSFQPVALLFYWHLSGDLLFVEHLAVAEHCRGQGVGNAVLQWLQKMGKPIILEIEPVVDFVTERRRRFYHSAGFAELPYEHVQLPYHADTPPVPMHLLSWPGVLPEQMVMDFEQELRSRVMRYTDAVTG